MLSEYECRVLQSGCDILLEDFDPRDATLYLESNGLLSQDDAEIIEHKVGFCCHMLFMLITSLTEL